MNDEPLIRLRPRKSKHNPNDNPRKYTGVLRSMLRFVQMSKRGRKVQGAHQSGKSSRLFNQRVAVRVSYSANKNPGQWKAHGKYVARDSATQGGRPAEAGFNAAERNLNIAVTLDRWQIAGDERLFKIILSPEFGDRLDLHWHTRELLWRMERDLGTSLEWVAAIHRNTEHPHVHIALRGLDQNGQSLRLPREYIRSGIRERAEEIATELLGYRSPADAKEARRRETLQKRYTSLDRILQQSNDRAQSHFAVVANADDKKLSESAQALQKQLVDRLKHLETMGLAQSAAPHEWRVLGDFEKVLRTLQQSRDRQRMLAAHGVLVSDKRLPIQVTTLRQFQSVAGRILLHTEDEQTGKRYMLLEGTDGVVHLIYHTRAMEEARRQGKLGTNGFARIEKCFINKKPDLSVEDLGDATKLLANGAHFDREAALLLRRGIRDVPPVWGGWLGKYQLKLQAAVHSPSNARQAKSKGDSRSI